MGSVKEKNITRLKEYLDKSFEMIIQSPQVSLFLRGEVSLVEALVVRE